MGFFCLIYILSKTFSFWVVFDFSNCFFVLFIYHGDWGRGWGWLYQDRNEHPGKKSFKTKQIKWKIKNKNQPWNFFNPINIIEKKNVFLTRSVCLSLSLFSCQREVFPSKKPLTKNFPLIFFFFITFSKQLWLCWVVWECVWLTVVHAREHKKIKIKKNTVEICSKLFAFFMVLSFILFLLHNIGSSRK